MRSRVVLIALALAAVVAIAVVIVLNLTGAQQTPGRTGAPASVPPGATTVVAAGDICTPSPDSCAGTAGLVDRLAPDAVLALGDNQYPDGTLEEYTKSYDRSWGRFAPITFPVAGNHEWHTEGARGFLEYFDLTAHWYTFTLGDWRLYALDGTCDENGGCDEGSPQYEWLAGELASREQDCIAAFWHQPRFSSGDTHGSHEELAPIWRLLDDAGAEIVLNGHEHNYERFAPQDADGNPTPEGIVEIVAGTGGNPSSYGFVEPLENSLVRKGGFGVVELSLWGSGWAASFVRTDGRVVDNTSGSC
ncbi:MAG TPA: metallophosphoesterase [Actinomycetota bacterium]|nr:metallophosphoesterase [Actinomycetota bacterium]